MKYIITESKLDMLMTEYLNGWIESKTISHSSPYIIVEGRSIEYEEEWDVFMEYDSSDGRLWINKDFRNHLMDLFNKSHVETSVFIAKFFEDKFGVEINKVD
jgi:hypothetical protein